MSTAADRARAYRLRRARGEGKDLAPEEIAWLEEYETRSPRAAHAERVVHVEERAGVAEGPAADLAAAALAREDGRRVDRLVELALAAQGRAADLYHRMAADLLAQYAAQQQTVVALLEAVRTHYLARIEAEGALAASQEPGPEALLTQALTGALTAKSQKPDKPE